MELKSLSRRYFGNRATEYDRARMSEDKWWKEQATVESLLDDMESRASVLDIPVGTGRFLEAYQRRAFVVTGMDISEDMLSEARRKVTNDQARVTLRRGDISAIDEASDTFDVVVCMRFLNWVERDNLLRILKELSRVSRRHLVVGLRHYLPRAELTQFGLVAGQMRARLGRAIFGKERTVVHEKSDVEKAFEDCRLSVEKRIPIERRNDGTEYFIYLLEK